MTELDSAALYRLLSWMSPSYPVGAFAYSHGLEAEVASGRVADRDGLVEWIDTILRHGTGRIDGVLFREAFLAARNRDGARIGDIAELGRAMQPSAEIAAESLSQGTAFLAATGAAWPLSGLHPDPGGAVYPIAVALACAAHETLLGSALHAYFHGFAANLVSAGVRLIPLGQTDGQRAVAALEPSVAAASAQATEIPLDRIVAAAPRIDLASMHHETQYSRLFRS